MRFLSVFCLLLIGIAFTACDGKSKDPAITELMTANMAACQREDMDRAMATVHPDSPMREQTETMLAQVFAAYDLSYTLDSMEILSNDGDVARVRVKQTTRKVDGPAFRDNRIQIVNELRKSGDDWKLYDSSIENISYLDQE